MSLWDRARAGASSLTGCRPSILIIRTGAGNRPTEVMRINKVEAQGKLASSLAGHIVNGYGSGPSSLGYS
jgi:hypothetical protein